MVVQELERAGAAANITQGPVAIRGSTSPVVELRGVAKNFGAVQALQDVSFSVAPGEVVALLGPNGAGKTTAISIMLGLREPTVGSARLFGRSPRDLHARSRIGVMLQDSGVPMNLKVLELVNLYRSYYPTPLPADRVIEMSGLTEQANVQAGSLSGGQRQRLYFALAICGDPELLFLDEPTTALDVESRRNFWQQIRQFVDAGKTIVLTTHYLEEADALADRIVVINQGAVITDASPAAIKSHFAGKRISFDLVGPLPDRLLGGLPVEDLTQSGRHATMVSSAPESVLQALFARGARLANLEVVGVGLEDAFLSLTHGEETGDGNNR